MNLIKFSLAVILCIIGFFISYGIGNLFHFDWKWVFVVYSQIGFIAKVMVDDDET